MTICIVGAGIVGLAAARDAALRGVDCVLIERGRPGDQTTTHCAGHLHSGARYALQSPAIARACATANEDIRSLAPFAVTDTGALYVCLDDDPPEYADAFTRACRDAGIAIAALSRADALEREPALGPAVVRAFATRDAVIDPFLLVEAHLDELARLGVPVLTGHTVVDAAADESRWLLRIADRETGSARTMAADAVINAAGPGAAEVSRLFDVPLALNYVNGSMAVLGSSPVRGLISRCAPTAPGDVIVPCGATCLVGSTWRPVSRGTPEAVRDDDLADMIATASAMAPGIRLHDVVRTYSGVRVSIVSSHEARNGARRAPSDSHVLHHGAGGGRPPLVTAMGSKLTLYRQVAEEAVDAALETVAGVPSSRTRELPLAPPARPSGRSLATRPAEREFRPMDGRPLDRLMAQAVGG